ncbi:uncharacterized protein LOC122503363 [Leptopilina heterotoma]|uniref:uncharacterized protein LOC122503363 n=1 Tax=Leptopilina heterotoma TaxID=63436 RepID=UPI001CA8EF82|nr:uncharacterized protein LOC122503363 [Leptopilina heterotoma]
MEKRISSDRFKELAVFAADLFPEYSKESFYIRSRNGKNANGAFICHYWKQREKEIAIGRISTENSLKRKRIVEDYVKKWRETALNERILFYQEKEFIEIFQTFPNLCHPAGSILVQADFHTFFKKSEDLFLKNWPAIARKVIKFSQSKKKDEEIQSILRRNTPLKGEEHLQNLALILLPCLFKRISKLTVRSKAKTSWCSQKSDVLKSFIAHIEATDNFQNSLNEVNEDIFQMYNSQSQPIQSYVVVNGPSLSEINSAFVILGDIKYQVATPVKAIDLHFQCLKVFHKKYPLVCNHIYAFLEKQETILE